MCIRESYRTIKRKLIESGVKEKIRELEDKARRYREESERILLETENPDRELLLKTFTTTMEFSEIF